jgi:RNA polymerase sigma-70 factor (ECF subfamily)
MTLNRLGRQGESKLAQTGSASKDSSSGIVIPVKDKRMVAADEHRRRIVESQNGDHGAFEALIRDHQRMIHSLCYRMSGSLADAEDLAQETFIHAYQHLDGFRSEARFSSWLYRIAVNQCLNWQKRRQRLDQLHQEWGEQDREPSATDAGRSQQIQQALMKLPPKQRAAVILTTYDGLTHAEAAAMLGCSETTVSWRLFAARGKLKRLLKDHIKPGATQ